MFLSRKKVYEFWSFDIMGNCIRKGWVPINRSSSSGFFFPFYLFFKRISQYLCLLLSLSSFHISSSSSYLFLHINTLQKNYVYATLDYGCVLAINLWPGFSLSCLEIRTSERSFFLKEIGQHAGKNSKVM